MGFVSGGIAGTASFFIMMFTGFIWWSILLAFLIWVGAYLWVAKNGHRTMQGANTDELGLLVMFFGLSLFYYYVYGNFQKEYGCDILANTYAKFVETQQEYFTVNNRYARSSEELTDQKLLFTTPSIDMEFTVVDNNKVKMT
ncbi:MAG: hypothetical protein ACI909_002140, partial [Planctomycetota bacterium]